MANVTIPNLTSATTIAPSTDLLVVEQTAGTRKATVSQMFTTSATSGSGLGITSGGVYTIKSGLDSDISDINTLLGTTSIASIGDGTVTGAIDTLNSNLSVLKTLWTNPNISINFPTQNITLSSGDYDFLIATALNTTNGHIVSSVIVPKGTNFIFSYTQTSASGLKTDTRLCSYATSTSYDISLASEQQLSGAESSVSNKLIPYKIYGIKI